MGILFGIIQSLLLLPMPLRILIELVIMTILMIPLMGLVKCGLGIVVKVLKLLNKLITMITRNLELGKGVKMYMTGMKKWVNWAEQSIIVWATVWLG